jgi:hypothetical protein
VERGSSLASDTLTGRASPSQSLTSPLAVDEIYDDILDERGHSLLR